MNGIEEVGMWLDGGTERQNVTYWDFSNWELDPEKPLLGTKPQVYLK